MKKWYIFILMTVLCISGCNNNINEEAGIIVQEEKNVIEVNETDGNSVSENAQVDDILMVEDGAKFMIEEYGFTEEELEGYDVTAFVNESLYDHPTEEYARKRFESEKEFYRITDEYLFNKYSAFSDFKENTGKILPEDVIKKIGYKTYENNEYSLYIYDLETGMGYYNDIVPETIDDYKLEQLKSIVSRNNIDTWDNEFMGPDRNTTGSMAWELSFELEDGSVRCYKGYAEYYSDFTEDMKSVWSMLGR